MLIAVLGVIILIVGIVLKRSPEPGSHFGGIITTVGIVVFALGIVFSAFKIIEPGKVGVYRCFLEKYRTRYWKAACTSLTRSLRLPHSVYRQRITP